MHDELLAQAHELIAEWQALAWDLAAENEALRQRLAVRPIKPPRKRKLEAPRAVIAPLCDFFGVEATVLLSDCRLSHVARARFGLCLLLRDAGWSWVAIGSAIGRDHSTVIAAAERGAAMERDDVAFRATMERVRRATKINAQTAKRRA